MKKFYILFILFFAVSFQTQSQTFVKADAAGANDGSSWADAFTDLSDALGNSAPGDQIWVAAGTYKPGSGTANVDTFFTFPHDLELYGGFSGSETMLSERDWELYETILSGDHEDNDVDDNFEVNRTDNALHVMWLTDTVSTASTIDGFTIRNGNTQPSSGSGNFRRGGAILCYGAPAIRNCHFTQNYGYFGGAVYPRGDAASGVIIEDCVFESNYGGFGGGIYLLTGTATLNNCEFISNIADSGNNTGRGGGVYNNGTITDVVNCTFISNAAPNSSGGGYMVIGNEEGPVNLVNCVFNDNTAAFGGAFGSYSELTHSYLNNCTFGGNMATTSGGATTNGFGSTMVLDSCTFESNEAEFGGAMYSQNDSSRIEIQNSFFTLNAASGNGGAISMSGANEPNSPTPIPFLDIKNCHFTFNTAAEQAGCINMSNGNMHIENSLIENNFALDGDGIGGAMSLNTSDTIHTTFSIINTTIVGNIASIGGGIANWKPGMESTSTLTLQNNIFDNTDGSSVNYELEDGNPEVISMGGNLSSDFTMDTLLTATNDLNGEDPMFVDYDNADFQIELTSPCVDAGIPTGAPLFDLNGDPRVDEVDMGAFENQKTVSTKELNVLFGELLILPNPIENDLRFSFESGWRGPLQIQVFDINGKIVFTENTNKYNRTFIGEYGVSKLPRGAYTLTLSNGKLQATSIFVK